MICQKCKRKINRLAVLRPCLNSERVICTKCMMEERTDLDRISRHSKRDKYKNKHTRESYF